MKKLLLTLMQIVIQIAKHTNKNVAALIDTLENVYALTASVKNQAINKMISVLVMIVSGKLIEVLVNNKIATAIEIVKLVNNYITLADIVMWLELWIIVLLLILKIEIQKGLNYTNSMQMMIIKYLKGIELKEINTIHLNSETLHLVAGLEIKQSIPDTSLRFQNWC